MCKHYLVMCQVIYVSHHTHFSETSLTFWVLVVGCISFFRDSDLSHDSSTGGFLISLHLQPQDLVVKQTWPTNNHTYSILFKVFPTNSSVSVLTHPHSTTNHGKSRR